MLISRHMFLLLLAASSAVLLAAYGFQYVGGLSPCRLCYYQRIPYALGMVLSASGLAWPRHARLLLGLIALTYAMGTGLGAHHAGVEWQWWPGPAECTDLLGAAPNVEALTARLLAAPVVRCDEAPWTLLGLSLAGYNALISAGLAGLAIFNWKHTHAATR